MMLDLLFLAIVLAFAFLGYVSGFWLQIARLAALVFAYLAASLMGKPLGPALAAALGIPNLLGVVCATGLVFFFAYSICSALSWAMLRMRKRSLDKKLDSNWRQRVFKILGAALAAGKAMFILYLVLCLLGLTEKSLAAALKKDSLNLDSSVLARFAKQHNLLSGMNIPFVGQLATLGKMATNPQHREQFMQNPKLAKLLENPKVKQLLSDPELIAASKQNNIAAILANPLLNEALEDPQVQELIVELGKQDGR